MPSGPAKDPRFFGSSGHTKSSEISIVIDDGDYFVASAISIFDAMVSGHMRMRSDVISMVLRVHFNAFPQYKPSASSSLLTPHERMMAVVQNHDKDPNTIDNFASTLRTIALSELRDNLPRYHASLVGTFSSDLVLGESTMSCLAHALGLSIKLRKGKPGQLSSVVQYAPQPLVSSARLPTITMYEYEGQLKVFATRPWDFKATSLPSTVLPKEDVDQPSFVFLLRTQDQRLLSEYDKTAETIEKMVKDGFLNTNDLLAIYIEGIGRDKSSIVGLDTGTQAFFEGVRKRAQTLEAVKDQTLIDTQLISGIARLVCTGCMALSDIYVQVDKQVPSFT